MECREWDLRNSYLLYLVTLALAPKRGSIDAESCRRIFEGRGFRQDLDNMLFLYLFQTGRR